MSRGQSHTEPQTSRKYASTNICEELLMYSGLRSSVAKINGEKLTVSQRCTRYVKESGRGLHTPQEGAVTALPSKHSSGYQEEDNQRTPGKVIWRRRCGQQDATTVGGRWR